VVVTDDAARRVFDVSPLTYEEAVRRAMQRFATDSVETSWHGAFSSIGRNVEVDKLEDAEGMIKEVRRRSAKARPEAAFSVIKSLGGKNGWLYANTLWRLRGLMDLLIGGVGLRRGRRNQGEIRVGDAIDFFRVEEFEDNRLLRLRAEMKVPGRAWLQFVVSPIADEDAVMITQTAFFEPKGLWGFCYWYLLYPVHKVIFRGMIRELAQRAEAAGATQNGRQR
jgi:hypothetical protein